MYIWISLESLGIGLWLWGLLWSSRGFVVNLKFIKNFGQRFVHDGHFLRGRFAGLREDFVADACRLLRDRFLGDEIWVEMGLPLARCQEIVRESQSMQVFRQMLFSRIVPDLKRIGLI